MKPRTTTVTSIAALVTASQGVVAADATPPPDEIIHHWSGDQSGERYGWAVSALTDIDGDGVREAIIGAPFHTVDGQVNGHTDVRSGATGDVLHRFDGATGDRHGYAMADAGDVDGDGVPDIAVGSYTSSDDASFGDGSTCSPAPTGHGCAPTRHRPTSRHSASTSSGSVTSTATESRTCWPPAPS